MESSPLPNCYLIVFPASLFHPVELCLPRPLCLSVFLVKLHVLECSWRVMYLPELLHGRLQLCHLRNLHKNAGKVNQCLLLCKREETLQTPIFFKNYISSHLRAVWLMLGRNQMGFISLIPCIQLQATVNTPVTTSVNILAEAKIRSHSSFTPE